MFTSENYTKDAYAFFMSQINKQNTAPAAEVQFIQPTNSLPTTAQLQIDLGVEALRTQVLEKEITNLDFGVYAATLPVVTRDDENKRAEFVHFYLQFWLLNAPDYFLALPDQLIFAHDQQCGLFVMPIANDKKLALLQKLKTCFAIDEAQLIDDLSHYRLDKLNDRLNNLHLKSRAMPQALPLQIDTSALERFARDNLTALDNHDVETSNYLTTHQAQLNKLKSFLCAATDDAFGEHHTAIVNTRQQFYALSKKLSAPVLVNDARGMRP